MKDKSIGFYTNLTAYLYRRLYAIEKLTEVNSSTNPTQMLKALEAIKAECLEVLGDGG